MLKQNSKTISNLKSLHSEYLYSLSEEEQQIFFEYTHTGDIILNKYIEGNDTLETYFENIYIPGEEYVHPIHLAFFPCLFFYTMDKELGSPFLKKVGDTLKIKKKGLPPRIVYTPRIISMRDNSSLLLEKASYYKKSIYPVLKGKSLEDFREMMVGVAQTFFLKILEAPRVDSPFIVYRGDWNKEWKCDEGVSYIIPTFLSTTLDVNVAEMFGREHTNNIESDTKIYTFYIHPECTYLFVDPVSYYNKTEYEVIFAPGNRYICINKKMRIFLIVPTGMEDLAEMNSKKPQKIFNKNEEFIKFVKGAGTTAAAGGGGAGKGGRRKTRRSTRRR
jgi:hypothetical protein